MSSAEALCLRCLHHIHISQLALFLLWRMRSCWSNSLLLCSVSTGETEALKPVTSMRPQQRQVCSSHRTVFCKCVLYCIIVPYAVCVCFVTVPVILFIVSSA